MLFVQLMPKILKVDMNAERSSLEAVDSAKVKPITQHLYSFDSEGFFPFCAAIVLGILFGKVTIPLPGGASFSLGNSGAPLIIGLIFGHFGHIGSVNISVKKTVLETFREFGLMLFLIGAGTNAGQGFIKILIEYGLVLFIYGAIMAIVPMIVGYLFTSKLLRLSLLNNLGSITGGMTSTPALGALIKVAETAMVAFLLCCNLSGSAGCCCISFAVYHYLFSHNINFHYKRWSISNRIDHLKNQALIQRKHL